MSFSCLKCSNCFPQHIEETQNLYHDLKGRTRITTFYHLLLFPVFQFCPNNSGLYFVPQNIRLVSVSSFCICYFLFLEGSPSSSHSSYLLSGFKHLDDDSHEVKHCFFQNTKLSSGRCGKTECRVFWSLVQCSASELCHSRGIIWPLWSGFLLGDISLMMIWLPHTRNHGENNAVENFESSVSL